MLASELIKELQKLVDQGNDLPVVTPDRDDWDTIDSVRFCADKIYMKSFPNGCIELY